MRFTMGELREVYEVKSDQELSTLASERELLTAEAREALELEMNRRGLSHSNTDGNGVEVSGLKPGKRNYETASIALFWAFFMSPLAPAFIAKAGHDSLRFLYASHPKIGEWIPYVWSLYASGALAIIFWVFAIRLGFRRLRELSRITRITKSASAQSEILQ